MAQPTGCRIAVGGGGWAGSLVAGIELLNAEWAGSWPTSARDAPFAAWVAPSKARSAGPSAAVGVAIGFSGRVNLGDIATGPIKHVIDCLYPVLGGVAGAPNDSFVTVLEAWKANGRDAPAVSVRVAELAG